MSVAPSQILYLEHGSSRLYAEAIQVVDARRLCWARPTLLIQGLPESDSHSARQQIIAEAAQTPEASALDLYDLEDCPDLIWPIALFQIAFDVDFFSLLVQLKITPNDISQRRSMGQLNDFIRSFWHTHAEAFQAMPNELSS
ncbi:MAG: hypothetical protein AAFV90_07365 [Cyanobacteria bacterium J06634_5]